MDKKVNKIKYLRFIVVTALWLAAGAHAQPQAANTTQPYPNKPLRIVVGFTPGGAVDFIARLNLALAKAVQQPDVREALDKQAMVPQTGSPAEFGTLIAREIEQTAKLMQLAGMKPE